MKRTRSALKNKTKEPDEDRDEFNTAPKTTVLPANTEIPENEQKNQSVRQNKINLKKLRDWKEAESKELDPTILPNKSKVRAVVDLKMMKEELRQLEDPPVTSEEKQSCFSRLPYSFFDIPCEKLAQNLLGKILVRRLENGTILKGRIVETEGYLGVNDKASHSYQNKITPRNIPMFMPPGTIYVYMTYGMYHCFNISSQEKGACVLIRAVAPLIGLDYMELLRNMQLKNDKKSKEIVKNVKSLKSHEMCNSPSKLCSAFDINVDDDTLNGKNISMCNNLWIENDAHAKSITIVAAPCKRSEKNEFIGKIIGDGCAVLIRALDPVEGLEYMINNRNSNAKTKSTVAKKIPKDLKPHELCNGPSKLCMAFQLHKSHSKYSMCSWKGLWLEEDFTGEDIKIVCSTRIGIDSYGAEWANKLLRYYIYGNRSVSKRDKKAESLLEVT